MRPCSRYDRKTALLTWPNASTSRNRTSTRVWWPNSSFTELQIVQARSVGLERLVRSGHQRGQQRHPRHDAGQLEPLVDRVVVAADRAESVERRQTHARGRVRVAGAAGGGIPEREAQRGGDRLGERHE